LQINITGKTKITGIFGYPVEHSLSPAMHNAAFKSLGLDYCYVPFPVRPEHLYDAVKAIRAFNFIGVNVTVPHKETVIPFLDKIHEEASFIGAVNTIVNSNGTLNGYNTDGRGFMLSLSENGVSLAGKDILIIGAGGASRSIGYYLCQKSKSVTIYNRTHKRGEKLARDLQKLCKNVSLQAKISHIEDFHLIVNATSLGLNKEDPAPFDTSVLKKSQIICDLIYKKTRLLKEASRKGCKVIDGSGMLLYQGILAFQLWTGKKPPREVMSKALRGAHP
jgi:shikimate dehydrogenase